jgi:SAM-dependent methyltransferase
MAMERFDDPVEAIGANSPLQRKANEVTRYGPVFIGGAPEYFHSFGVHQLVTLLEAGLMPHHYVLDVGCGALRGGYWVMHFLNRGRYHGIEPNRQLLQRGIENFIPPGLIQEKAPRFDHNADFDFGGFKQKFDFVIARSVWTHHSEHKIEKMLDEFLAWSSPGAIFLASYRKARTMDEQYKGENPAAEHIRIVRFTPDWVVKVCSDRGLRARELRRNIQNQFWVRVERIEDAPSVTARPAARGELAASAADED